MMKNILSLQKLSSDGSLANTPMASNICVPAISTVSVFNC